MFPRIEFMYDDWDPTIHKHRRFHVTTIWYQMGITFFSWNYNTIIEVETRRSPFRKKPHIKKKANYWFNFEFLEDDGCLSYVYHWSKKEISILK